MSSKQLLGIPWRVALALQADGWWLRSACPWLKRNSMPESTTDRPTTSHEYWFLFAKSGDTQYWTHRELPGTRKKPKADYRWIHASGQELTEEPEGNWKCQKADCPECGGTGSIGMEAFGQEFISTTCGRCKGEKRIKAWQRVNLWKGHDYFWDGEAIKEHCQSGPSDIKKMVESRNRIGGKHKELNDPYAKASNATNIGQKRAVGNPAGRNRRTSDFFFESLDVTIREHERYLVHLKHIRDNGGLLLDKNGDPLAFSVPTRGFKGAHFATFPCDLIEPLIRASTSEKGCCPDCGAPWRRATEIERFHTQWGGPTTKNHQVGMGNAQSFIREGKPGCTSTKTKTVGWSPTCDCPPHDPVPCVVGDTFGGAATVGLVADRSGRDALLIELNEEYAEMGRQRIAEDAGPMLLDLEIIGNSQVIEPEQLEMFAITL